MWKLYNKLVISRSNGEYMEVFTSNGSLVVKECKPAFLPDSDRDKLDAIFGFYCMPLGHYMAYVSKSSPVEDFPFPGTRRVDDIKLIRIPSRILTKENFATDLVENQTNAEYLMQSTYKKHAFYFSTSQYDISSTLSANEAASASSDTVPLPLWMRADKRYFWNQHCVAYLTNSSICQSFIVPMVSAWIGCIDIDNGVSEGGTKQKIVLISRRSWKHQGPRLVANG